MCSVTCDNNINENVGTNSFTCVTEGIPKYS